MDLAKLVERVEGLSGPVTYAHALNIAPIEWFESGNGLLGHFVRALEGSLDAAVSFVEAVLPGWDFSLVPYFIDEGKPVVYQVECMKPNWPKFSPHDDWFERGEPARHVSRPIALILASLRALHTREGRG